MAHGKALGRDCELSTTGLDARRRSIPAWQVTREVLEHVGAAFEPLGTRVWSGTGSATGWASSSDCLRRWAPNGQCYYADSSHVEVCTAETRSPRTFGAQCLSVLRVIEAARARAQSLAEPGTRYALTTACVDLLDPSIAWGPHVNVEVSAELWEDLLLETRRPARLSFVASSFAAAIPFFGAGYLLPMRDGSVEWSLASRAHHLRKLVCFSTTETYARGLLNSRREPHGKDHERLHLIGFDFALAGATLLGSFLQSLLAAAEIGLSGLQLYDPVRALHHWSFGLDLSSGRCCWTARLVDGRDLRLCEYVEELSTWLARACERGDIGEDAAPEARELLPRVVELAQRLGQGDLASCARQLDWAAKLLYLRDLSRALGAPFADARVRLADHDFASTDPLRGAFWRLWRSGHIDPLVGEPEVDACLRDGPPDCRGWARGQLIQRFAGVITDVDWSYVELGRPGERWAPRLRLDMPALDSLARAEFEPVLARVGDVQELERWLATRGDARTREPIDDLTRELAGGEPHEDRYRPPPISRG